MSGLVERYILPFTVYVQLRVEVVIPQVEVKGINCQLQFNPSYRI